MNYSFPSLLPMLIIRMWEYLAKPLHLVRARFLCACWGVSAGKGVRFEGETIVRTRKKGEIRIGSGTIFNANRKTNLVGLLNPTILDTRWGGRIEIGAHSGFSSVVISSKKCIKIGNNVLAGGNVRILDHDFHSTDSRIRGTVEDIRQTKSKAVEIGNDVFIGTNVIILKGTRIGDRSIVAAGSVIFGLDVPPDSLVRGNPATFVQRKR